MSSSRIGLLVGLSAAIAALGTPAVAGADPSGVATTGTATSVTATAATLNGVIDPRASGTVWFFQYSPSIDFRAPEAQATPASVASPGLSVVATTVSGLAPGREYWFRTVVGEPSLSAGKRVLTYYIGHNVPLTPGHVSLSAPSRLRLHGRAVPVKLDCQGRVGAPCDSLVSLAIARRGSDRPAVTCGAADVDGTAPDARTLELKLGVACRRVVALTGRRGARGTLRVGVAGSASAVTRAVTIVR